PFCGLPFHRADVQHQASPVLDAAHDKRKSPRVAMRIYFGERSDPMITGTVSELNALASQFSEFAASAQVELRVPAVTAASPAPYEALLPSLRLLKRAGPIKVTLDPEVGLSVAGSPANLTVWCSYFRFPSSASDGDHHHPESVQRQGYVAAGSLSTIIEMQEE